MEALFQGISVGATITVHTAHGDISGTFVAVYPGAGVAVIQRQIPARQVRIALANVYAVCVEM